PIEPFAPEPPPAEAVTDDEILRFLIGEGLRPSAADDLTDAFRRIRLLGLWPLCVVLVFELLSGFLAIECPIDRDAISVGSPVPGAGFRPENPDLAESALPQTLLGKEADLQFRLIQPTSVYRRV